MFTEQEKMQKLLISKWNMKVFVFMLTNMITEIMIIVMMMVIMIIIIITAIQVKRRKKLYPGKTGNDSESSDDDVFYRCDSLLTLMIISMIILVMCFTGTSVQTSDDNSFPKTL